MLVPLLFVPSVNVPFSFTFIASELTDFTSPFPCIEPSSFTFESTIASSPLTVIVGTVSTPVPCSDNPKIVAPQRSITMFLLAGITTFSSVFVSISIFVVLSTLAPSTTGHASIASSKVLKYVSPIFATAIFLILISVSGP